MKKIIHSLAIAVVALAALFTVVFAAGCNSDSGADPDKMTVSIVYSDGKAYDGTDSSLRIQLCKESDGTCTPLLTYAPDANGKIIFSLKDLNITDISEGYKVEILPSKLPEGYTSEAVHNITKAGKYTLVLTPVAA